MPWLPITRTPIQYEKTDGNPANGYYLKFYLGGTTTPTVIATDSTGATQIAKCKLNENGYPISNPSDETSIFIPHVNSSFASFRYVIYLNAADADANNFASAVVNISSVGQTIDVQSYLGEIIKTIDTYAEISGELANLEIGQQFILAGHTVQNIGGGIFDVVSSSGRTANGGTVVINGAKAAVRKVETWITPQMFGALGDGINDDTSAINAAIAAFPGQGTPTWTPWSFLLPPGKYKVTGTINIKNQQGSSVFGYGAVLFGNFNGTILQIGDLTGSNDVLWTTIAGLNVQQNSTGLAANAVVCQHLYNCTIKDSFFYGGQYSMSFNGNGNLVQRTTFRRGITANVIASTVSNNEVNLFQECAFELSLGYGLDLQVNSGVGGGCEVKNCYFEVNAGGNVRAKNSNMFRISGNYFNLQNGAPGVILDGTVGGAFPAGYGIVENNRILGHATLTPGFIVESSGTSINCSYNNNQLEGGLCDLYGLAPRSINIGRRRDMVYVLNADAFSGGPPPTGWTVVGGVTSVGPTVSNYGSAASLVVPAGAYAYQAVSSPTNALLRFSVWVQALATGVAELQIWSIGLGSSYKAVASSLTTRNRLELFLSTAERAGASSFLILLRNTGAADVSFSDIKIEDMTN